jgi:hypothetical protein
MIINQANTFRFCHRNAFTRSRTRALIALLMEGLPLLALNIDWELPNGPISQFIADGLSAFERNPSIDRSQRRQLHRQFKGMNCYPNVTDSAA